MPVRWVFKVLIVASFVQTDKKRCTDGEREFRINRTDNWDTIDLADQHLRKCTSEAQWLGKRIPQRYKMDIEHPHGIKDKASSSEQGQFSPTEKVHEHS